MYARTRFRDIRNLIFRKNFFFPESTTEWYFWLITLNSTVNPWIYIALNRDLRLSLYQCCCPCFSNHAEKDDFLVTQPQKSSNDASFQQSRPRSYTTSQVQVAKLRPNSAQLKRNQYSSQRRNAAAYFRECNDIPMRCRINTFQL